MFVVVIIKVGTFDYQHNYNQSVLALDVQFFKNLKFMTTKFQFAVPTCNVHIL